MAHVTLTDYEVAHDVLPPVCARCGEPAAERVDHPVRVIDGWRGAFLIPVVFFGLCCFPPLFVLALWRWAETIVVRVPLCTPHAADQRWRDRVTLRVLLPIWTIAVLFFEVAAAIEASRDEQVFSLVGLYLVGGFVVLFDGLVISRRAVKVMRPNKTIMLRTVHRAFVEALVADRARDRIDNPDRRAGHGDQRDDFDDEPV